MYKYLFGPVQSRRLGISLGIDLLPYKFCSYNCVYCECGASTRKQMVREEFFPLEEVRAELQDYLASAPKLDYITFSGSGEPLLYSRLGELLSFLKSMYCGYKVALLTNSSLLPCRKVRESLRPLDLCVPSLDSATQEGFMAIDRPARKFQLKVGDIIEGIKQTREIINGQMWLEIFIVPGINDTPAELKALQQAVAYIRPHKVQVNSLDRPGTEDWVPVLPVQRKKEISAYLEAEILDVKTAEFSRHNRKKYLPFHTIEARILQLLAGGTRTSEQLCARLDMPLEDLEKILKALLRAGVIVQDKANGRFAALGKSH